MNFGQNNGPETSKEVTNEFDGKGPSRRDVLKGLAKGVGVFGVANLAGISASQALLRSTERQSAGPIVERIEGIPLSEIPNDFKGDFISVCEESIIILDSIKTEKQINEINDGKVPNYKRNDLTKEFGFVFGTSLTTLGIATSAKAILKKLEEKGLDVTKATPALILSAAATLVVQEVGNEKMEERRYMKHPSSEREEDMNIVKAIFGKELDSGKKITKKDIEDKINYFIGLRDSLKNSLNADKKS